MPAGRTGALGLYTAKGDFIAFDGTNLERLPVGSNGLVIVADSTTPTGLRYALRTPVGYLDGGMISPGADPDVDTAIAPGVVRSSDDTFDIAWVAALSAANTALGVNGLDVGAVAPATLYHEFVIADTTLVNPVAALFSLSPTAPILPGGYNKMRRMGAVLTDATSDFFNFVQTTNGRSRRIEYDVNTGMGANGLRVLTNGSSAVFLDVDLSPFVPSTSENVRIAGQFETGAGGAAADEGRLRPDGFSASAGASGIQMQIGVVSAQKNAAQLDLACPGQLIEYTVDDAVNNQLTLNVIGYVDKL